jgi:hypothetical protein
VNQESYTIVLSSLDYEFQDENFDFDVSGGDSEELIEIFDPVPMYQRGLWFDTSYLTINNLMLNHSFTIHFWIDIIGDGTIFSISHGGYLFILKAEKSQLTVLYTNLIDYAKGGLKYGNWHLITCFLEYSSRSTAIDLLIDHTLIGMTSIDSVFIDSPEHLHLVGATMVSFNAKGDFISSYIYEFSIFPYVDKMTSSYIEIGKCGSENYCEYCPV